jgi:hypothetical protein
MARAHGIAIILAAALLAGGCSGGKFTVLHSAANPNDYSPNARIRVMLAAPDKTDEAGTRVVSARIVSVLQQTHSDVALIPTANESEALDAARAANATFLITPTIIDWNDSHAPPLTADRVKLKLDLRDPRTGEVLNSVTFENISSLATAFDTTPDALLDQSFVNAVTALVATPAPSGSARQ